MLSNRIKIVNEDYKFYFNKKVVDNYIQLMIQLKGLEKVSSLKNIIFDIAVLWVWLSKAIK